jgi:hypothetical protein
MICLYDLEAKTERDFLLTYLPIYGPCRGMQGV